MAGEFLPVGFSKLLLQLASLWCLDPKEGELVPHVFLHACCVGWVGVGRAEVSEFTRKLHRLAIFLDVGQQITC